MENEKLLTIIQAARLLNRTKPIVYKLLERGDFPNAREVDGIMYVPYADVLSARQKMARLPVETLESLGYAVQITDKWCNTQF